MKDDSQAWSQEWRQTVLKARENKKVLSCLSKFFTSSEFLITAGISFQILGAATENARDVILSRVNGTQKLFSAEDADRRFRTGIYGWRRSDRYEGWPRNFDLKAKHPNLKLIRSRTGSQCKSLRTGVMWSERRDPETTLAREFWTLWSFFKFSSVVPIRTELQ